MEIADGFVAVADDDDDDQSRLFGLKPVWFRARHRMICVRRLFNYSTVNLDGNEPWSNKAILDPGVGTKNFGWFNATVSIIEYLDKN